MPTYTPPLRDMRFVMHEVLKVADEFKAIPKYEEADAGTIDAVLEEAGKFASEVTFPLNMIGDVEGCKLDPATHEVATPPGFKQAYAKYVEGGWPALSCDPAWGGQGLPLVLNQCLYEMLNAANQAWTGTGLTLRKGDVLTFNTTGQVQLSTDTSDIATPAGFVSFPLILETYRE